MSIVLNVGNSIKNTPKSSQIIYVDDKELYALLDEPKIYIFDLEQDSLLNTIDASVAGKLLNYSGFTYVNDDSIFAYNYGKSKTLSLINSAGQLLNSYPLRVGEGQVSPETLTTSPIIIQNGHAILCGTPISSKSSLGKNDPIGVTIRLSDNKQTLGGAYSNEYEKGYFGGLYMNFINDCIDSDGRIIFSFPASNYIYRYDNQLQFIDSLYMGSRYINEITGLPGPSLNFLKNKDERLRYYLSQSSYSRIIYDRYNNLYYRIAHSPAKSEDEDNLVNPFSIIVMTTDGKLVTETPLLDDYQNIISSNAHITRHGLIMQKRNENDNIMEFVLFKLNDHEN
jgi:hypothetical protein